MQKNPSQISQQLSALIRDEITQLGYIPFSRFMELALYAPNLGYYVNPLPKFGKEGDFTTAPETSQLFAMCLAKQTQEVLHTLGNADILEFGGGSGRLMVDLLRALHKLQSLPSHYYMIEISPLLKEQQQQLLKQELPDLSDKVIWVDQIPPHFQGVIIANEVLDAMPVHRFHMQQGKLQECCVTWEDNQFADCLVPAQPALAKAVAALGIVFEEGYTSEINLALPAWIGSLNAGLQRGLVLIIDYGYPRHEYYHPQRWMGTLMCHYQHRAHMHIYEYIGSQDITAFVDFTAISHSASSTPLMLNGYTTQGHFLLSCGLLEMADNMDFDFEQRYAISQQLKKLLLPSQMGEAFKVLALTKDLTMPLLGFTSHNMQEKL